MRIAFVTPCVSRLAGGIFEIERRLAQSLHAMPATVVEVYGVEDEFSRVDAPLWAPLQLHCFPFIGPAGMRFSPGLTQSFCASDAEIAHLHALWMHTSIVVRKWSRATGQPYVTTLNGMLEPWALANSTWKKTLTGALYEKDCLHRAACLQVNSRAELGSARAFGLRNPVAIIPNGVDIPEPTDSRAPWADFLGDDRKVLLYLGRLHPKKGLVALLRAWAVVSRETSSAAWKLAVAGWDQGGHEAELRQLCDELGLPRANVPAANANRDRDALSAATVLFLGPQYGEAKCGCLRQCDALALPSFSEGLPMVVLEAWAHQQAVLLTPGCNLPEGAVAHAAIEAQPEVQSLADGLRQLFSLTDTERDAMGDNGLALVRQRFTWTHVAANMRSVYEWVIGGGPPPHCVTLS